MIQLNTDIKVFFISFLGFSQNFFDTMKPIQSFVISFLTIIYIIIKIKNEKNKKT